ncbi:MAG: hypothetical protein KJ929_03850 [Euryarchaeota archaeon]|nr:hypothetical protein [Euryarchaeota archaeon]
MDPLLEISQKLQSDYFRRMQLLFILDLISVFCIVYAITLIFQMEYFLNKSSLDARIPINIIPPILSFIIAVIAAFLRHKNDHKIKFNLLIESKYPELKEKVRTAYDNISESNVIVDSLKNSVLSGLTIVSASTLLATSVVVTKIIIVMFFVSGVTVISSQPEKYTIPVETIEDNIIKITGGNGNETSEAVGSPEDFGQAGGFETKPKIATIEGKNIDLTIFPGYEQGVELVKESQIQNPFIKSPEFPVDIMGSNVSDGGYSSLLKKTETEKQLINKFAVERSKI